MGGKAYQRLTLRASEAETSMGWREAVSNSASAGVEGKGSVFSAKGSAYLDTNNEQSGSLKQAFSSTTKETTQVC